MAEDGTGDGLFGGDPPAGGEGDGAGDAGGDDFQVGEWAKDYSDDTKNLIQKQKWENLEAVFSSYVELRSNMDGASRLTLPDNADDKAGWDAAMTKLGMPETAEDYEFTKREEGQTDLGEPFKAWARDKRLTQTQAKGMLDDFHAHQDTQAQIKNDEFLTQRVQARTELVKFWGEDAEANETLAGNTAMKVFKLSNEMVEAMEKQVGTRETMEAFLRVGKALGSHDAGGGGDGDGDNVGGMSRSQADARHAEIMSTPAELKRFADGDPAINAEVAKLNEIRFGTAPLGVYESGVPV